MQIGNGIGLIICLYLLTSFNTSEANPVAKTFKKQRKIILDTDAGADDAVAILLYLKYEALNKEDFKLIAITCTHGNTEERNVEENVLKILTVAQRNDIPVYAGAEKALIEHKNSTNYYGHDGLGDFSFQEEIIAKIDGSKLAAVALLDLVKAHPEVTIICIGPLTNIALATRLDSKFIRNVGELFIMSSTVNGFGNEGPNVEFNIGLDPESAFIVMNSTKKPFTLVPWDIALNFPISKEWRKNVFGKLNSSAVRFLNKAGRVGNQGKDRSWATIDAMTLSIIIWPDFVKKLLLTNVTPVYDGAARGSVLVDYKNFTGKQPNAKIVQEYDVELFKEKLLQYFAF
ncbi:inosine-uridine preferring nucleoside hydrolase-like isoform X2 [Belonocnema kinseyi]|uniref:inosine-uridine preferring nucleoside hydrolase-like isoform X2 n=1 Tax=Belonocnema kinseyi TaxID=2817044 RepID=UPI00143D1003|nr:inosine-uridine preferring nucleoside hydrolase-like isoform X2 [Belonocnema kinseyi]